jgi:hypothetical protein
LKVGPVGDGARIDDGDVRCFSEGNDGVLPLFEVIDQSLGLELVHLTTKRSYGNSRHSWIQETKVRNRDLLTPGF